MYAIVEINGQQFKAEAGKKLFVHHIKGAQNDTTVEFDRVLLLDKEGAVTVGAPTVEGAKALRLLVWWYCRRMLFGRSRRYLEPL